MDHTESAWVFDSLVGFLHGPIWNIPLQAFIEEKSLPFEPTDTGETFERPEYKHIHNEYKNLVDVMLGSFMDDIGISADQFEEACRMSAQDMAGLPVHFHRRLFEQIWAANDYEIFVKVMTHKNVELQLQALELIEQRMGALPSSFSTELDDELQHLEATWNENDDIIKELTKLQIAELQDNDSVDMDLEDMEVEKRNLLAKLQNIDKEESGSGDAKEELSKDQNGISSSVVDREVVLKKPEVSDEEVQARHEYLKQQRDKLVAMKKQVREHKLGSPDDGTGDSQIKSRPKSARMAAAALAGQTPAPPPNSMSLRKALASKLKAEVVDGKY